VWQAISEPWDRFVPWKRLSPVRTDARACEGARDALEAVYLEHRTPLLRLAWLLTGSRMDAEDVVHDVIVRYGRIDAPPDNPRAYLRKMVVHAIHDLSRKEARTVVGHRTADPADPGPDVVEVWEAVRHLHEDLREAVVLRYHDDMSQKEISQLLGLPIGTVRSRISRGLSQLREVLHD
jgi:RNA polymerase sigma factor (sigma-70 family)